MAKRKNPSWRSAFAADEVIQRIRPEYSDEFLNNPHKGTATFQRFEGDSLYPLRGDHEGPTVFTKLRRRPGRSELYPPTRIAYCRWTWAVLEPRRGKIRFDIIDAALAAAASRGQTLQVRTMPFVGLIDTPRWYRDIGAYMADGFKNGETWMDRAKSSDPGM